MSVAASRVAVAALTFVCLVGATAAARSVVATAASPVSASTFEPTFLSMASAAPASFSRTAVRVADAVGIVDRRVEAARVASCIADGGQDCARGASTAAVAAPLDGEIPLVLATMGAMDPNEAILASCRLAPREAWVALRRARIATAASGDGRLTECLARDADTLLASSFYADRLAELYVASPTAREGIRAALTRVDQRSARAFLRRVRAAS